MPVEIERKFLVKSDGWREIGCWKSANGEKLCQGYLQTKPSVVRVRTVVDGDRRQGFLTVKGKTSGVSRAEYEYEVPYDDANEMLKLCEYVLSKTRYHVLVKDDPSHVWHVDVFEGAHDGLVTAEIELGGEDEDFVTPDWLGEEVSHDNRYANSNLAKRPLVPLLCSGSSAPNSRNNVAKS
jgi:CYTH domain-containing protein